MLLVLFSGCASDGKQVASSTHKPASAADVRRAFASEGFDLFASRVDGQTQLFPLGGEPFVIGLFPTAAEATQVIGLLNEYAEGGDNLYHRARNNVVVSSDGGLSDEQQERIATALSNIGPGAADERRELATEAGSLRSSHAVQKHELEVLGAALLPAEPTVYCWDDEGWNRLAQLAHEKDEPSDQADGLASPGEFRIDLSPWVCETLAQLPHRIEELDPYGAAAALGVFVHEVHHLGAAQTDEALAECLALQTLDTAASTAGLAPSWGRRLTEVAWEELYPDLPAEYRSKHCRAGGAFDQEPESPAFP